MDVRYRWNQATGSFQLTAKMIIAGQEVTLVEDPEVPVDELHAIGADGRRMVVKLDLS
jgi:hypothetical protein